ncbi:MAG: substrate-binding domain-containing protein [Actinobacteria bacterium]|nr:substrate-binding domain-containing protein [Actinomycetota bacterium]
MAAVAAAASIAVALAGCGGGEDSGGGSGSTAAASPDAQVVQRLYRGTYEAPPPAPRPQPGKKLLLLSCGQSLPTCAQAMSGAQEAAKAMGWSTTIFDTKGDPNQASAGIRQALVSKVDGVFVYFTDCRLMKQALQEARDAKLPVVAAESLDCDFGGSGQPLFAGTVRYVEGSYADWIAAYGKAQAQYVIAKTGGKAKMLDFMEDDLLGAAIQQRAQQAAFRACGGCGLYPVKYTIGDLSTGIQQKAQQALLQHPDADSLVVQYDAVLLAGVSSAAASAGRSLVVMAAEGDTATMDLVRSGKVTAGVGIPIEWEGYAGVDALNRLMHGEQPASSGIGIQVYDRDHNTPASGPYRPPIDFRAAYRKAWGLGG